MPIIIITNNSNSSKINRIQAIYYNLLWPPLIEADTYVRSCNPIEYKILSNSFTYNFINISMLLPRVYIDFS